MENFSAKAKKVREEIGISKKKIDSNVLLYPRKKFQSYRKFYHFKEVFLEKLKDEEELTKLEKI